MKGEAGELLLRRSNSSNMEASASAYIMNWVTYDPIAAFGFLTTHGTLRAHDSLYWTIYTGHQPLVEEGLKGISLKVG